MKLRIARAWCLVSLIVSLLAATVQAEDWPRWRGPRGDGTWHGPRLTEKWPADGLKTLWKQDIGGGYGGISVSGTRLYLMDFQKEPQPEERVRCFDTQTGDQIWIAKYPVSYKGLDYPNGPRITPTIDDGRIYTIGSVGHAYCFDAATGRVIWQKDPQADYKVKLSEWGVAASPVIYEDLVIIHPGATDNGCLIAFHKLTGQEVWRAGKDPCGYATPIVIDSPSGKQLVLWSPKHILGHDPLTGREYWRIPYEVTYGVSIATPIYQEGLLVVCGYWEGSKAIRLGKTPTDAKLEWEDSKHLRGLMSQPLHRDGLAYLLDKQLGLTCFELATGKKLWDDAHQMTPRGRNPQSNLVWLDAGKSDRTIILNSEGELILARLNREGYHESARTKIIDPTWAHPAFAGNRVFARNDTQLVCVELTVEAD